VVLPEPLRFCDNVVGLSCCNSAADATLREEFEAMNMPGSDCPAIIKAILCACIPSTSPKPVNASSISSIPPRCRARPPPSTTSSAQPQHQDAGICLERLAGAATYQGMAVHPDGSGRAFLYTQDGKVSLAMLPPQGSGAALQVDGDGAILDLGLGGRALIRLTGLALHPEFAANGRLFVAYTCDSDNSPACGGAGTSSSSYPPATAGNGFRYQLVVEEFTTKGGVDYGMITKARRIFATGLPPQLVDAPNQQHGGQIFFRPSDDDGHLYLATGHGGGVGGAASSPFLGKIVRLDVDSMPGNNEPQIFAAGLSNPRGCSFDSMRPSDLYCAGVDEQRQNEQVYLISNHSASPATAAVSVIISHGRPTGGHIVGGILNRGPADPFLNGRYVYIYNSSVWAAAETPASNGLHAYPSARIPNVRCESSLVPCGGEAIAGSIVFLGQDSIMDVYIITVGGIYRVIPPGLCAGGAPPPTSPQQMPPWLTWLISILGLIFLVAIPAISSCLCGGAGAAAGRPTPNWYLSLSCCSWNCCSSGTTN